MTGIQRRQFLSGAAGAVLAASISGRAQAADDIVIGVPTAMSSPVGAGDQKDWLNGVTVAIDEINAGGGVKGRKLRAEVVDIDILTPEGTVGAIQSLTGKKVQAINTALIPSWKTLDPRLQNGNWFTVNGQHYGTPYQWGANFLAYNSKLFKAAPTSWAVVFEPMTLPDGKPNKGRIQAYDGPIYIADAAMYLMSKNPALGIKDPYELNEVQYAAVLKLLRQQKPLTHRYWHDVTIQMNDFKNEGIAATSAWGYTVNSLQAEKFPVSETIPREGATGWADTTMLATSAQHPVCSYKWMEWSLNRNLQSSLAEWFGSNPVVPQACNTKAPGGSAFCKSNGFDHFDKIHFWKTPTAQCKQGQCVSYSRWTADYISIMGGR